MKKIFLALIVLLMIIPNAFAIRTETQEFYFTNRVHFVVMIVSNSLTFSNGPSITAGVVTNWNDTTNLVTGNTNTWNLKPETITFAGATNGFVFYWTPGTNVILQSVMMETMRGAVTTCWSIGWAVADTSRIYEVIANDIVADNVDGSTVSSFSQSIFTGRPNFEISCTNMVGYTWSNETKCVIRAKTWVDP